ncbi:MAG: HEAT repeat domain-containing protein [Deltaproteobacteria bacterium]|nr:HEAT repeat domain-containing protein [Deltaproteobacteria bacterium]
MLLPMLPPSIDAALRDVASKDPRSRARAAESLARAGDDRRAEAVTALRPLVADESGPVRFAAIAALGGLHDLESLDAILERFEDPDALVRQAAVIAAADIGDPRAAAALRAGITDGNPDVRFQAVVSYALLCPEQAVSPLVDALDDGHPEVRANAATALGNLLADATDADKGRAARALAARLDDSDKNVRHEAALALAVLKDERAGPRLVEALSDPERAIDAAESLGELAYEPAREPLARHALKLMGAPEMRVAAAFGLAKLGDPRGATVLRKTLSAWRSAARAYAVDAVGRLGLAELADAVEPLVERPRGADPVVVVETLGRLAARSSVARAAIERAAARDDEVGIVARRVLGGLAATTAAS